MPIYQFNKYFLIVGLIVLFLGVDIGITKFLNQKQILLTAYKGFLFL